MFVHEGRVVPGLGVDADDDAERRRTARARARPRATSTSGSRTGTSVTGIATASRPAPISSARTTPPIDEREVDLPRAHRRGEHVVEVAVEARLEDRRRVVGVGGLDHRHRDQAGHDEDVVVERRRSCLMRPPSESPKTRMNSALERTRRDDRLRPQLEDAGDLAAGERDQATAAARTRVHRPPRSRAPALATTTSAIASQSRRRDPARARPARRARRRPAPATSGSRTRAWAARRSASISSE